MKQLKLSARLIFSVALVALSLILQGCGPEQSQEQQNKGSLPYEARTADECLKEKACADIVFKKTNGKFIKNPNLVHKLPKAFPVKNLIFSQAQPVVCDVNVFQIKDDFPKIFEREQPNNLDLISVVRGGESYNVYQPWQRTPIHEKLSETSKANLTLKMAEKCLSASDELLGVFKKYIEDGAFFTYENPGNTVLLYIPAVNLLYFLAYD